MSASRALVESGFSSFSSGMLWKTKLLHMLLLMDSSRDLTNSIFFSFMDSNYRPISLLPIFSKIFEKPMYSRLLDFIKKHNNLSPNQFGFQKSKSTELAVNSIVNNIINSFEVKESAYCIFLDFAKAFDTVNHEILINKLEYYGIRGSPLKWFKSYLSGRQQFTEIDDTLSDIGYIKCGVPQGSILGPLLFLIYTNDIVNSSTILKFFLFADDTTLFF